MSQQQPDDGTTEPARDGAPDAGDGVSGPPRVPQVDFAALVEAFDPRSDSVRHVLTGSSGDAGRSSAEAAAWIRSFLEAARNYRASQAPAWVGTYLQHRYAEWWAERSQAGSDFDSDELAHLLFDSRRVVNLVGVRGVTSAETVQLAFELGDADVVVDLVTEDDAIRVEGQVLTSETARTPPTTAVLLRCVDDGLRPATLDHLNRFAFEPVHGPDLELLVRLDRRQWRLPLRTLPVH